MALGSSAFAINFDANLELDNTYRNGTNGLPDKTTAVKQEGLSQSGRVEMNAAGKAGANLFVAGRASFLAKKDGSVGTDDMWIQFGSATSALKLGRFEAADLFPLAGDTLVNHAGTGNVYGTNTLRGRKAGTEFHAAATTTLGNGLSLELGIVETKDLAVSTEASTASKGFRPVVSYAVGALSLSAALESGKYVRSGNDVSGAGATVSYNLGMAKLTGNLAKGKSDVATRNAQSAFALTVAAGGLSVGVISATNETPMTVGAGEEKISTVYASYSMPLFDIKGASVTPAISSSAAKNGSTETSENSLRVRLNYAF